MWEENLETKAGVHFIEGVRLPVICNIQGEIVFQKLQNFWVAKALMSLYILYKTLSF